MDADRFPKPDVPWHHEVYPTFWTTERFGHSISDNGWECTMEFAVDQATCDAETVHFTDGSAHCRLDPGHDGPHFAVYPPAEAIGGRIIVTSLRRVARAEVA